MKQPNGNTNTTKKWWKEDWMMEMKEADTDTDTDSDSLDPSVKAGVEDSGSV